MPLSMRCYVYLIITTLSDQVFRLAEKLSLRGHAGGGI